MVAIRRCARSDGVPDPWHQVSPLVGLPRRPAIVSVRIRVCTQYVRFAVGPLAALGVTLDWYGFDIRENGVLNNDNYLRQPEREAGQYPMDAVWPALVPAQLLLPPLRSLLPWGQEKQLRLTAQAHGLNEDCLHAIACCLGVSELTIAPQAASVGSAVADVAYVAAAYRVSARAARAVLAVAGTPGGACLLLSVLVGRLRWEDLKCAAEVAGVEEFSAAQQASLEALDVSECCGLDEMDAEQLPFERRIFEAVDDEQRKSMNRFKKWADDEVRRCTATSITLGTNSHVSG